MSSSVCLFPPTTNPIPNHLTKQNRNLQAPLPTNNSRPHKPPPSSSPPLHPPNPLHPPKNLPKNLPTTTLPRTRSPRRRPLLIPRINRRPSYNPLPLPAYPTHPRYPHNLRPKTRAPPPIPPTLASYCTRLTSRLSRRHNHIPVRARIYRSGASRGSVECDVSG